MTPYALNAALAVRLFHWRFAVDYGVLVPPDFPTKAALTSAFTDLTNDSPLAKQMRLLLEDHAAGWEDNAPVVPDYLANPLATVKVWQWVEQRHGFVGIGFQYQKHPRGILCLIHFYLMTSLVGQGTTWQEALCRAALALQQALQEVSTP